MAASEISEEAREYAEIIINTVRESLIVLDDDLRVISANRSFYEAFQVKLEETVGQLIYDLGNKQWDIPKLRQLLETLLTRKTTVEAYEVEHEFAALGRRTMLFNAMEIQRNSGKQRLILLAIEDITERKSMEGGLHASEERFRQWFESSPISLWEEDFSAVKKRIDEIKDSDVGRLDSYFRERPDLVWKLAEMVKILDVNKATLDLYRAETKEEFFGGITKIFSRESLEGFLPVLEVIASGEKEFITEKEHVTFDGDLLKVQLYWTVAKGHEKDYSRVLVSIVDITQRRQAEEALRGSEERFRIMLDSLPGGVFAHDLSGRILFVNKMACNNTGYSKEELLSMSMADIDPGSIPRDNRYRFWNKSELSKSMIFEATYVRRDGSQYPTEIHLTAMELQGKPALLPIAFDITERKRTEEALRRSENYYRAMFETSGAAMFIGEDDTTISLVNQNFVRLSGYSKQEIEGKKSWTEFVHPDDVVRMKENHYLRRQNPDAAPRRYEFRFITRNEEMRHILLGVDIIPESDQSISSCIDITERKRAEEALTSSLSLINAALDSTADGILVVNRSGIITRYNQKFAEMWRIPQEIFTIGNDANALNHILEQIVDPESFLSKVEHLYAHPEKSSFEQIEFKDGRIFERYSQPQIIGSDIVGRVWSFRDITERRKAEEKIRYLSYHDSLTGLYNRAYLEEEMKRLNTERQLPIGVIMVDLNGLKLVNDTYGHAAGDKMLRAAASVLRKSCRKEDIIARWGGDEFVILLPQIRADDESAVCRRIKERCCQAYVENVQLSMALGLSIMDNMIKGLDTTLKDAEDYMYQQKSAQGRGNRGNVLSALLKTLGEKSFETEKHTRNMENVALKVAGKVGLSDSELSRLRMLITLHDIGKINVPGKILIKEEPLSADDWEVIKKHPEMGCRIARAMVEFANIAEDILAHHERWDGGGYPHGLQGEEISLLARITSIADAYEVMANGRPYKKAMPKEKIVAELKRCAGTQFDPELTEILLSILDEETQAKR